MKPVVFFLFLSKFGMFIFVVLYTMEKKDDFWVFGGRTGRGKFSKEGRTAHETMVER